MIPKNKNEIVVYEADGEVVRFNLDEAGETIWATQAQIAEVFRVKPQSITRHLRLIFESGELEKNRTCKDSLQVQNEGGRQVTRKVKLYNLDAIISVGYRVNSARATQFRIWANKVLKQYIMGGVAVNERRLKELPAEKLKGLEGTLGVVRRLLAQNELTAGEAQGILEVITSYAKSFRAIEEYGDGKEALKRGGGSAGLAGSIDAGSIDSGSTGRIRFRDKRKVRQDLAAEKCVAVAEKLRKELGEGDDFGKVRGKKLAEGLAKINDSKARLAEKAARLLYFIVREKPFVDGNKRIGALAFIVYLTMNDFQLAGNGETKISDRALTALVLLIAESEAKEKELLVGLVGRMLED